MCGIAGILHWGAVQDPKIINAMTQRLAHRGPDDSGTVCLDDISLGHRRLSIIDLSVSAKQPMVNASGNYYIVFNGEICNFQDIKKELQSLGYKFLNKSDTEVALNAYECWGPGCLRRFNGMFALAIWDVQKRELFIARDRFGKKPLYYYITKNRGIVFASELDALLADQEIYPEINMEALNCYLALGYILAPLSIYKDVYKLEQASYMIISERGNRVIKEKYWDYAQCFRNKTSEDEQTIAKRIVYLMDNSVKLRMISDVPVGAFLSGGIDSSLVVSRMKQFHKGDLHTFSIGFEEKSYNDLQDADSMAHYLGTSHHAETIKAADVEQLISDAIDAFDEPFADNSLVPMLELSRLAAKHVKVVLSGEGADEMFAGYITYKADRYYRYSHVIPAVLRKAILNRVRNKKINADKKISFTYKLKQFLNGSLYDAEQAHYLWRIFFLPEERVNILGEQFRQLIYDTDPFRQFKKYYDNVKDLHWLDRNLYVDGMTWLTDDILVKVDRTTMRCGIEARCPFLDVELSTYAASISAELKMKGLNTKYILKRALKNILPKETLSKKKSGFNAPLGKWIGITETDEFRTFNKFVYNRKIKYAAEKAK